MAGSLELSIVSLTYRTTSTAGMTSASTPTGTGVQSWVNEGHVGHSRSNAGCIIIEYIIEYSNDISMYTGTGVHTWVTSS